MQDMGFLAVGENITNTGDDIDGAGGAMSSFQDSPEYQRIRIEMEHIQVSLHLEHYENHV